MKQKEIVVALKREGKYQIYDMNNGRIKPFSSELFTSKHVTSFGDVPVGATTSKSRVVTFNPWIEPDLLFKALMTKRLNDKLIVALKNGEFSEKARGTVILFKLDDMSAYWIFDGENLIEYTIEMIPALLERECHVLRNSVNLWSPDPTVLPTGPKMVVHENPDKFVLFCFCTEYARTVPPMEIGPSMVVEISQIQNLEVLSGNALRVLGSSTKIECVVKLLAGYKTAKFQPNQPFLFCSLCLYCCLPAYRGQS